MSKWEKLLERLKTLDKSLRFEELRSILEEYGYTMNAPKGGSSHYTFRKASKMPITIPKSKPIKIAYIRLVKNAVEKEEEQ